jgi:hypothetical protein
MRSSISKMGPTGRGSVNIGLPPIVVVQRVRRSQMNLSTVATLACTVGAFVSDIKEDADSVEHHHPRVRTERASVDVIASQARVGLLTTDKSTRRSQTPGRRPVHRAGPRRLPRESSGRGRTARVCSQPPMSEKTTNT